jgi:hypothetical protein
LRVTTLASYQSSSKRKAARLRALQVNADRSKKSAPLACFFGFVCFGVAFGNQKVHRSKVHRMSVVLTFNCIGHRKSVAYKAVEFQSLRRICGAAEFWH